MIYFLILIKKESLYNHILFGMSTVKSNKKKI